MSISIRSGDLGDLAALAALIPELADGFDVAAARGRLQQGAIVLVAQMDGADVGFKAGYDRFQDGTFYSWLGGVVPAARRQGVADLLMQAQHRAVQQQGYHGIYVKTRNRYIGMRILLARNGYQICGFTGSTGAGSDLREARLLHYRQLQ